MICRKATVALPMPIFSLPTANPLLPEHKIVVFVRFCPSKPPFSGVLSTKSGFLCAFWLRDPHFPAFRAHNWHFCVRMGDFFEIFGRFDTKMGFLCSGSITMVVPANHRAHFKNVNSL